MAKQLNVNLNIMADTRAAEQNLNSLRQNLNSIASMPIAPNAMETGLNEAIASAQILQKHLNAAFNVKTGNLDLTKFNSSLTQSGEKLSNLSKDLTHAGKIGQQAFLELQRSIQSANLQINKTSGFLGELGTTFMNTLRWQATSSVIHGIVGGLSQAYGYAEKLNKSLTDIRIVAPEKSIKDMAKFAKEANEAAKELSSSTLDYTEAALIYYQQGLGDTETAARTDVTVKMANVTGDSADEVSSYMTAIWNNFNKAGDESEEHYADILTKLGADTAASTSEITTALEKYSAVASTIGLSYEAATAAATTLIDRTREAPEVAGTALKTIFARIEGLKQDGFTDEGGTETSYNKYSQALANIGVEIKGVNGEMKNADDIIDEIGKKWKDLQQDQKIALAETVAGVRQWNQFSALMENYDYYEKYKQTAETGSEGSLQKQQDIYAESWEAARDRVKAAFEEIYVAIFDDQVFIKLTNIFGGFIDIVGTAIETLGGLKGILLLVATIVMTRFSAEIVSGFDKAISKAREFTSLMSNKAWIGFDGFGAMVKGMFTPLTGGLQKASLGIQKFGLSLKQVFSKNSVEITQLGNSINHLTEKSSMVTMSISKGIANAMTPAQKQYNKTVIEGAEAITKEMAISLEWARNAKMMPRSFRDSAKVLEEINQISNTVEQNTRNITKEEKDKLAVMLKQVDAIGQLKQKTQEEIESLQTKAQLSKAHINTAIKEQSVSKAVSNYIKNQCELLQEQARLRGVLTELDNLELKLEKADSDQLKDVIEELYEQEIISKNIKDTWIQEIQAGKSLQEIIDTINTEIANIQKNIKNVAQGNKEIESGMEKMVGLGEQIGAEGVKMYRQTNQLNNQLNNTHSLLGNILNRGTTIKGMLPGFIGGLSSIALSISMIQSAIDTLNDKDATFVDKLVSSTMALSFVMMSLQTIGGGLNALMTAATGSIMTLSGEEAAAQVVKMGLFTAEELEEKGLNKNTAAKLKNKNATMLMSAEDKKAIASVLGLGTAEGKTAAATRALSASIKGFLLTAGPIILIIAAIATALKLLYDRAHKARKALEENTEAIKQSTDAWNELCSKANEVGQAYDKLAEQRDKIKGLAQGTAEWHKEVNALNKDTLETVRNFNSLNNQLSAEQRSKLGLGDLQFGTDYFYDSEGVIQFAEGVDIKMAQIESAIISEATINESRNNLTQSRLELVAKNEELTEGTFGVGKQLTHSKQYLASEQGQLDVAKANLAHPETAAYTSDTLMSEEGRTNYNKKATKEQVSKNTLGILQGAVEKGLFSSADLYDPNARENIAAILEKYGMDEETARSQADLVATHAKSLETAIIDNTEATRANSEAYTAALQGAILQDQTNPFYNYVQGLDQEDQSGAANYLARAWSGQASTYTGMSEEKLEEHGWYDQYAKANGLTGDKTNGYKDSTGADIEVTKDMVNAYRSEEKAMKDLERQEDELIKTMMEKIEDTKKDSDALTKAKNVWNQYGDSIEKAKKKNGQWNRIGEKTKEQLKELAKKIAPQLIEALDIKDDDLGILNGKFIAENADIIEDAMDGDINAIQKLQTAYAEAALETKKSELIDTETIYGSMDNVYDQINNFWAKNKIEDIPIGTYFDDTNANAAEQQVLNIFRNLLATGEYSADKLNAMMGGAFDLEFDGYDIYPAETDITNTSIAKYAKKHKLDMPVTDIDSGGIGYHIDTKNMDQSTENETIAHFKEKGAIVVPHLKGAKRNTNVQPPAKAATDSRARGGDGGKKGGKSERKARPRRQYEKSTVIERYKEITDSIDKTTKTMEKLAKVQDQLYGKSRLKQMEAVNKKHLEELKLYREKAVEAKEYLLQDKAFMQQRLKEAVKIAKDNASAQSARFSDKSAGSLYDRISKLSKDFDFTYGPDGEIQNYTALMTMLQDELNAYEAVYNAANTKDFPTEEDQNEYKEKYITSLSEAIDRLEEAREQYDETRNLLDEIKEKIDEVYTEWRDGNYEMLTYELELKVTVNNNDLKLLEHKMKGMEDDVYKAAELLGEYFSGNLGDNLTGKFGLTTQAVEDQVDAFKKLTNAYQNGEISQANYMEGMLELYDNLISGLDTMEDLKAEMKDYYSNVLDKVIDQLNIYNDRLNTSISLLNHYKSILELTGKGANYNLLEQLYGANAAAQTVKINQTKALYEFAKKELEDAQGPRNIWRQNWLDAQSEEGLKTLRERLKVGNDITDEALKDMVKKEYDAYNQSYENALSHYEDAEEQMFESVEEALESAANQLETALERAAKAVEDALTGIIGGFEELTRQMDLTSTRQDEYLTKTNQGYELNKMQRTLSRDMDKTDSKAAKAKLANFSKELKALEEKDELSNLELEIAQKKYELLKAQIALEESQNAKQTIRLSRDNEGNYGYIYVADEDAIEEAQQAVDDANNDLYNLQLEATNEYGQKYLEAINEYKKALNDFYTSDEYKEMTEEQRNERVAKIQEQYNAILNSYKDLYGIAYGSTDYLVDALKADSWIYNTYNDNIEMASNSLSAFDTYIKDVSDATAVWTTQIKNITDQIKFDERMENIVTTTEETVNNIAKEFEQTGEILSNTINDVKTKIEEFIDTLLPSLNKWTLNIESILSQINDLLKAGAEGKIDQATQNFNQLIRYIAGENGINQVKYADNNVAYGLSGLTEETVNSWSADTIASNEIIAKELIDNAYGGGSLGYFGFDEQGKMSYYMGKNTDPGYKTWANKVKTDTITKLDPEEFMNFYLKDLKGQNIKRYATGGYTGDWNNANGKLAILDEKELVLNANDTNNILAVVDSVRQLAASGFLSALTPGSISNINNKSQQIEQQVKIDAQFPNVSDRNEIEQAFNNLVNRAAQHAYNSNK